MTIASVIVEVAFSAASTGTWLHLDDTERGLLDTGTLADDEVWIDVTSYVRSWSTQRGVSRTEGPVLRYEAGRATIVLRNEDRRFDPANLDGPYVSAGVTQVTPMRAVRVRATHGGTTYDIWRGYADSWTITYPNPSYSECVLQATDGLKVLQAYDRAATGAVGAGEDTGARVARILTSASWPASDRVLDTGDSTLQATTLEGSALTEIQLAVDSELGEFYMDKVGRATFRRRQAILEDTRSATSQAVFDDDGTDHRYAEVELEYDDDQLINAARITRVGGAEQSASDSASITSYLTHVVQRSDLIMETDAAAADWADWVVYQGKDPELRFSAININPRRDDDDLFPVVLAREIGDRITVNRRPPGGGDAITRDVFIRGIEHRGEPHRWHTRFALQSATRYQFLTLDSSSLGTLDSNALGF